MRKAKKISDQPVSGKKTKLVMIDSHTIIEVDFSMSDDAARRSFLEKIERSRPNLRQVQESQYLISEK